MCESTTRLATDVVDVSGRQEGCEWVIVLRGEVDVCCSQALRDGFAQAATAACERVVVDASGVTFLDGAGLRVLLCAAAQCDRGVWLRSPSRPVRWIGELVGLGPPGWSRAQRLDEVQLV